MNILPFEFIEDVVFSRDFDGKIYRNYDQVLNLRISILDHSDYVKLRKSKDMHILRWILKHEVYLFFKTNSISIDLMEIRSIDLRNLDLAFKPRSLPSIDDIPSLSERRQIMSNYILDREYYNQEFIKRKYNQFPLACEISDEDITMMKLSI